ncbi:MAG: Uridine kinase, partial [Elusimicrobia bacterium]
ALTVIGIPQIVKNFRGGKATVKDLVLSGNLIWFGAATLLSVVSIGNGASLWWNLANVAGVLESAIVVGQINAYKRDKAEMKATALTAVGAASLVGLIAAQAFMPLKAWLDLSFTGAMGLLWVLNAPQIRHNHQVWLKEGRVADGIAPLYPILVTVGSLLHLFTALVTGDVRWAINAVIGIATASIVLGQIYAPKTTNALLRPVIRLIESVLSRFAPRSSVAAAFAGASLAAFAGHDAAGQVSAVVEKAKTLPGRSVIFLEAPTAAGKSTLAKSLEGALVGRLRALEIDRYYGNVADAPRDAAGRPDFDRPDALKLDRAAKDIRALLAGERVELPSYDMASGLSNPNSGEYMQLDADDVLIVDSIFASHPLLKAAAEGRQALDVYMDAPAVVRLARRLARDKVTRGKPVGDNLRGWARILENEAAYIKPLRDGADAVINLVTPEELAGLPAAYEKLLAEEADPVVRALMGEMIRASLRADGAAR